MSTLSISEVLDVTKTMYQCGESLSRGFPPEQVELLEQTLRYIEEIRRTIDMYLRMPRTHYVGFSKDEIRTFIGSKTFHADRLQEDALSEHDMGHSLMTLAQVTRVLLYALGQIEEKYVTIATPTSS